MQVAAIHRRDVAAGADAVLTNTFGANRCRLARFGRAGLLESINRRAVELARSAAGPNRFVLGSMGPTCRQENGAAAEQAVVLASEGVDAAAAGDVSISRCRTRAPGSHRRGCRPVPVFVSLWKWPACSEPAVRRLVGAGQPSSGSTVSQGPAARGFAELPRNLERSLAGEAERRQGPREAMSPADLMAVVPKLVDSNVRLIGGCCGTTEKHVAAVAACAPFHRVSFGHMTGDKA